MHFNDKCRLYFNDQRRFGWVKLLPTELVEDEPFMQKVGPEPLEPEFTADIFAQRGFTVKRRTKISPRIEKFETIVWFPDDYSCPSEEAIDRHDQMVLGIDRRLDIVTTNT